MHHSRRQSTTGSTIKSLGADINRVPEWAATGNTTLIGRLTWAEDGRGRPNSERTSSVASQARTPSVGVAHCGEQALRWGWVGVGYWAWDKVIATVNSKK